MRLRPFKYVPVFSLPVLVYISLMNTGWLTYLPLIEAFIIIPFLELLIKPDPTNLSDEESELASKTFTFDLLIYLIVPVHLFLLFTFFQTIGEAGLTLADKIGRTSAMGLSCGVFGINVAHELGHRKKRYEKFLAKILLLTSLYMHFFIEHNRGHHKRVSTPEDPSSARKGENLYRFWIRSVVFAYLSAWRLEADRLRKRNVPIVSIENEMLLFQIIQLTFIIAVWQFFGFQVMFFFLCAAVMGFLLLETVNYIEHYGLQRVRKASGYERVMPRHSWNSDHHIGRMMLFELSRHSDHHYMASRKYQVLRHISESPQMPTGYPGMMMLALIPPIWFGLMNRKLEKWNANV